MRAQASLSTNELVTAGPVMIAGIDKNRLQKAIFPNVTNVGLELLRSATARDNHINGIDADHGKCSLRSWANSYCWRVNHATYSLRNASPLWPCRVMSPRFD